MKKVPTLNLSEYRSNDQSLKDKFIKDLYNSFEEYGFVVIKGHDIPRNLAERVFSSMEKFFSLPVEVKNKYDMENGGQRGYTKFGVENAKGSKHKDLKEFYHAGREQFMVNVWPKEVPDYEPSMKEFISYMDKIGDDLLSALGVSLGCGPDHLPELVKDGASVLRMLHYPPLEGDVAGKVRAAAHEDISALSCLYASGQSGLELLTKEGDWIPVESNPDEIVVNLGDLISRMTNLSLRSTTHRVVNPQTNNNVSRYSIPYFIHFRGEVELELLPKYAHETPKLPLITSKEYLHERLKEIGLKK